MPYVMDDTEFEAVMGLRGADRYAHFLDRVADWEEVWSLRNAAGLVGLADDGGQECIPVWPHPRFATALAQEEWSDCGPTRISLHEFVRDWLDSLDRDGLQIAVFPDRDSRSVVVAPEDLRRDIVQELHR